MANIGGIGGDIESLGNAASALFSSQGNAAEANSYTSAGQLEEQNAQLTAASTRIQETQTARGVAQSLGTTQADVAAAGFTNSGSALDVLRSSAQQGSLQKSLINIQGAINENSYASQAGADFAKAKAANEANTAGTVSAIASIGGALISGGTKLAQAGTTVSKGVDYVSGLFGSEEASIGAVDPAEETGDLYLDSLANESIGSATDASIGAGADIGSALETTDIGLDTSGVALGTTEDAVTSGITDALSGSIVGDVGEGIADAAASAASGAAELGASIAEGASEAFDAASAIGDALAVAVSVICTALYYRKLISVSVWGNAQRYGWAMDRDTFRGYLLWATPIATCINRSERFAHFVAPIFIPSIEEMGVAMGRANAKRTTYGFVSHRILFALSWSLGRILKGSSYVKARA